MSGTTLLTIFTCTAVLFWAADIAACIRTMARVAANCWTLALRSTARVTTCARSGARVAIYRSTLRFRTPCGYYRVWALVAQAARIRSVVRHWARIVDAASTGSTQRGHNSSSQQPEFHLQTVFQSFVCDKIKPSSLSHAETVLTPLWKISISILSLLHGLKIFVLLPQRLQANL